MPAPAQDEFVAHVQELMAPLGRVAARRMFGGWGLYLDGLMVALIADERLYLKADATTRERFAAAGSAPFTYAARGRRTVMAYMEAPDGSLDEPDALAPWAALGLEAALRARAARPAGSARARSARRPRPPSA